MSRLSALTLSLFGAFLLTAAPIVAAAGEIVITIRPATATGAIVPGPDYFVLHARAGSALHRRILVGNSGSGRLSVRLAPVDAVVDTRGGIAYALPEAPRRGVGAWVRLASSHLTLPPRGSRLVTFVVRIPAGTPVGRYIGALTVWVPHPAGGSGGEAVLNVQTRLADAVVVTVTPSRKDA